MYQPKYTRQFNKDVKRLERSGSHDMGKLKGIIRKLINGEPLEPRHKDHKLTGNYEGYKDCHIEPDWLVVYKINTKDKSITFARTGSHADIFE
ncbi:MAG: type II toxin-antitoxin system YafQ family toxin [Deltaproteobacteria bacterium]|nr:type II toxin-antitoxin system YafQ family toxin [Deltaproteobacteria bacterium]